VKTYQVTLDINTNEVEPPQNWDWVTLLDLDVAKGEGVDVADVQLIADDSDCPGEGTNE
jgi:hypothetical protein